jgi:hypothetical protein
VNTERAVDQIPNATERVPGALNPKGLLWSILLFLLFDIAVHHAVGIVFRTGRRSLPQDELQTRVVELGKRLDAVEKSISALTSVVSGLNSDLQNTRTAVDAIEKTAVREGNPTKEGMQHHRKGK